MSLLRIGTPTPIKSTTAKIVKSIQSPHISLFFITRMDKKIETAYITTIAKTARKTRSIGEDSTTEIIEFPIAGILERRSKVTDQNDFNAQFTLVDEAENGIADVDYEIETNDGERHTGKTDSSGKTANLSGYTTADCRVSFLNN